MTMLRKINPTKKDGSVLGMPVTRLEILSFNVDENWGSFCHRIIFVVSYRILRHLSWLISTCTYLHYTSNLNFKVLSLEYPLFRSDEGLQHRGLTYRNLFNASVDAFVCTMEREVPLVVTETGWPMSTEQWCGGGCRECIGV
ncbi:hypothetical protein Pint_22960 [Pistacia integerrima]|uniref:Uncharacterized protein n=1 Tax=Pistacia integerrima TaxID=434235 RepID=A0ACC0YKT2_9ROSI|nr:hypothetical protein Pint_22960 [Pistacia integerrima]